MNDRFLFRGKVKNGERRGEWITGSYIPKVKIRNTGNYAQTIWICDDIEGSGFVEIDSTTISQCTSLRDKNGTLIFEGDVVKTISDDLEPEIYRIAFDNFRWEVRNPVYDYYQELYDYVNDYTTLEIIGNIHDAPELLEVVK